MIQIITTNEALQEVFNRLFEKALLDYQPKEGRVTPVIVTGEELCKKLGITIQTLIRWRKKGKVPFMQIGSAVRYDLIAVIAALEVGKRKGART